MSDIWTIIGISSLIASVVTVILGLVRDVLVEKYRFKRQSQAGYIQSQIRLYSQVYFLLRRPATGEISKTVFPDVRENIRELNDVIRKSSDLLETRFLNLWLDFIGTMDAFFEAKKKESEELIRIAGKQMKQILAVIKEIMNENLIPKYQNIVGETVPYLD